MDSSLRTDTDPEGSPRMMEFFIRAVLIIGLAWICYRAFSPFITLAAWSIVLAVTLYPVHQKIARRVGKKEWLASLIIVVVGLIVVIVPTALLMNSFADSVRGFIESVNNNSLQIPAPSEAAKSIPAVGTKVYDAWSKAYTDLPGFVQSLQPKIGELARVALETVASIGTTLLLFLASFIIASIVMAYGESGASTMLAIGTRVAGREKGADFVNLSAATIRTVALGVLGVAAIQAILVGVVLLIAGVPGAGVLAIIALLLGIAQIPAIIVILPAIAYIWTSGSYETSSAVIFTVVLLLAGLADNVLKPVFLGRGVNVPMPVILFGALGGMASAGILGMFVGATALALGYEIFMAWMHSDSEAPVSNNGDAAPVPVIGQAATADS
jgi:predicted PurR-regulated permease PerM